MSHQTAAATLCEHRTAIRVPVTHWTEAAASRALNHLQVNDVSYVDASMLLIATRERLATSATTG